MLKQEIKNLSKKKPSTSTQYLKGSEWKKLCSEFDISNKYFLEERETYLGGVELDIRGFKKLVILTSIA